MPVVLTGSQLAHGAPESDAPANLSLAIRAAVKARADAPACIAFGGALMPAISATKAQAEELRAFRAERDLGPEASGVPKPVSYTHLDVYKRQLLNPQSPMSARTASGSLHAVAAMHSAVLRGCLLYTSRCV